MAENLWLVGGRIDQIKLMPCKYLAPEAIDFFVDFLLLLLLLPYLNKVKT